MSSSSTPPPWLPPLNSHNRYAMTVVAFELDDQPHALNSSGQNPADINFLGSQNPAVKFIVNACVYFNPAHNKNTARNTGFMGLYIQKEYNDMVYSDLSSPPNYSRQTISNLFGHMFYVPFEFNRTVFIEQYYNDGQFSGGRAPVFDLHDLIVRLSRFVNRVKDKPNKRDKNMLFFGLSFMKTVWIPDQEYEAWTDWYNEKKRSDPYFEENYMKAISRPRTYQEIIHETTLTFRPASRSRVEDVLEGFLNDEKERSCSICLAEIVIGSEGSRLRPCKHAFHVECITRWLLQSKFCPICRFSV